MNDEAVYRTAPATPGLLKLDQETWLVPDPIGWLFGQNLDYFRPYKNQVEPGCKDYPIEFIVNFKTI